MANFNLGDLIWRITGDTSQFDESVGKATKAVSKFGKFLKGSIVAGAITGVTKSIISMGKEFGELASDAEETQSKFEAVFSSISRVAGDTAKNLADNFGFTSTQAQKLLGDTGDLLTGFGFTQEAALDLSTQVNELAADLASFTNYAGGSEGASQALTKALLGETEQAKALGIVIRQGSKEYQDSVESLMKYQGLSLNQAKAETALRIATEQSVNAVGDYQRTMDSTANVNRRFNNSLTETKVLLGETWNEAVTPVKRFLTEGLDKLNEGTRRLNLLTELGRKEQDGTITNNEKILLLEQKISDARDDLDRPLERRFKIYRDIAQEKVDLLEAELAPLLKIRDEEEAATQREQARKQAEANRQERLDRINQAHTDLSMELAKVKDRQDAFGESVDVTAQSEDVLTDIINKLIEDGFKGSDQVITDLKKKYEELTGEVYDLSDANDKARQTFEEMWAELDTIGQVQYSIGLVNDALSETQNILGAIDSLRQAQFQAEMQMLDAELQARLNADDVRAETEQERITREIEDLEKQVEEESDLEKKKNLEFTLDQKKREQERLKITEDYEKKKAQIEYEARVASWEAQLAQATAQAAVGVLNAVSSALSIPPPAGPILAGINGALAATTGALQIAAVAAAKPPKPQFAVGAMNIPRDTDAIVHKGETIVPATFAEEIRQGNAALVNPSAVGSGGGGNMTLTVNLDGRVIAQAVVEDYINTAQITIDGTRGIR